jgi:transposase
MSLMQRLFRREPPPETSCPRCATPVPGGAVECSACGWDMRESYHEAGSTGQSGA